MEIKVTSTKDLPAGKMIGIESNGEKVLIANLNGEYYAIGNVCTHMGCILSEGSLVGEKVQCPCHGSTFDIRNGSVLKGPATKPEAVFKTRVDGDQIFVSING
ncbi:MAG: Rieske (2Fe-2S) protein [Dehalococcoidia bacterium]|jgi:nitrite reductase/ring-hydroxylating ferredoxin subunit